MGLSNRFSPWLESCGNSSYLLIVEKRKKESAICLRDREAEASRSIKSLMCTAVIKLAQIEGLLGRLQQVSSNIFSPQALFPRSNHRSELSTIQQRKIRSLNRSKTVSKIPKLKYKTHKVSLKGSGITKYGTLEVDSILKKEDLDEYREVKEFSPKNQMKRLGSDFGFNGSEALMLLNLLEKDGLIYINLFHSETKLSLHDRTRA
ncbi:hypothetical protein LguiB_014084 [Lonicera macranthoides]